MLISSGRTKTTQRLPLAVCALLASTLVLLFSPTAIVDAEPSDVIQTCINNGCNKVFSILDPCGGGATNETLQQSLIFTPTQSLGGCQCNTEFYNAFSLCLSCIASQAESFPEIQNQQDWNRNCEDYGFPVGPFPIVNSTNPIDNNSNNSSDGSGLSTGAIVGIVVGVLVVAALVGAFVFVRRRNQKQEKSAVFEPAGGSPNGSDHYNHAAATADTADHNDHAYQQQQEDYPTSYQQNDYYNDQHAHYQDPSSDSHYQNNNSYAAQHAQDNYYSNDFTNGNANGNGNVSGYYDTANVGPQDTMMMQNLNNQSGNGGYVPPPPHPASPTHGSSSEVYATSPRSSDTFPQSLRNKPKTWGTPTTSYVTQPQELTSGLIATEQHSFSNHQQQSSSSQFNDKTEFDDGEQLEPPAPYLNDFPPRRSMTPPRATMQSYRDEFNRPSLEREPRRSGSDRGSISGAAGGGGMGMNNMIRGSDNGSSGGYGFSNNSNSHVDYDQQGEQLDFSRASQDSPEGARRRARAAELFSAEGTRR
ncbi:hypothetical protein BGZ97_006658 [Linnemannia gamsii]|jgi:hypothetical protein|uniref:Uncharacterized protein n=1 Tax=Linnemannia gamsii TaxID=64522 RepID=A0A9P6QRB9_9FUNG|nr:hypothetical protein BGZ97_006658 [Linnemannia gamsii]